MAKNKGQESSVMGAGQSSVELLDKQKREKASRWSRKLFAGFLALILIIILQLLQIFPAGVGWYLQKYPGAFP